MLDVKNISEDSNQLNCNGADYLSAVNISSSESEDDISGERKNLKRQEFNTTLGDDTAKTQIPSDLVPGNDNTNVEVKEQTNAPEVGPEILDFLEENVDREFSQLLIDVNKRPLRRVSCLESKQEPRIGYTGLENLGNTCFMNSVIQFLSNTQELRDYFTNGHFKDDINETNCLGSGGHVALSFAVLLRHLWSGSHVFYSPAKLKSLLSEKFSQFSGFAQHDAQEYMSVLLDVLHEDINRIREKPYVKINSKDGDDDQSVPDEELADDSWHKFRIRNSSIIVDLFYGQFKSRVVCSKCPKVSITFDPFLLLPVPMPKSQTIHTVYFHSINPSKKPIRLLIKLPLESKIGNLLQSISSKVNVEIENLRIIHVNEGTILSVLKSHHQVPLIEDNEMLLAFECLSVEKAKEPVREFAVLQRLSTPRSPANIRCAECNKPANADRKLKRCTKCFRSSYCDRDCQKNDWPIHRKVCAYVPEPVGCPFIISVPRSQCTYSKLIGLATDYSRHSVDVNFPQRIDNPPPDNSDVKDNDSGIYSDTLENSPSPSSNPSSTSSFAPPSTKFILRHHPNHMDISDTEENIIKEPENGDDDKAFLDELTSYYLSMEWNNMQNDTMIVETKDLDHNIDILEAQKISSNRDEFTLEECLKLFIEPEVLSDMEAWYCPSCKSHREASKQLTIWRLPPILVIQLKRFLFKNLYFKEKINKFVKFPLRDLDMAPYMCPNHKNGNQAPIYDLYAVINHYGGLLGGHYTTFARTRYNNEDLGWRVFDDNRVEDIDEADVVTNHAYLLFYRLKDEA